MNATLKPWETPAAERLTPLLADWSMSATHIPTDARKKGERVLRYSITLQYKDRDVLTTPYHMGIGHIKSVNTGRRRTILDQVRLATVLRTGREWTGAPILPALPDVLHCIIDDSDAMEYSFDEWAGNLGYDTDSRKAEKIYRQCIDLGLTLQRAIGAPALTALREAFQDY